MPERPLILLDVDGVLNPFTRPGPEWERHKAHSFNLWLNPNQGAALLALAAGTGAQLVWATTWEHDANTYIGPIVGLPELPVIEVTKGEDAGDWLVCSKTPPVAAWVNRRPFVWLDDDLGPADKEWLARHDNVGAFRLIHVGGRSGLNGKHLEQASAWLAQQAGGAA